MNKKWITLLFSFSLCFCMSCSDSESDKKEEGKVEEEKPVTVLSKTVPLADPYILVHDSLYYIYGTNVGTGFDVYYSKDLEYWERASALSLSHANSYGESMFWAPEVYYVEKDKKRSLVFRPHPLTFKNFISLGLITSDEVDEYLRKFQNNEQLYYDQTSEYFTTFWHSDVFVGDISSIIPCYFLTGKPIIYCHTDAVDDNDIMKKIFSVSYNAYSFEDVEKILLDLQNGIDPLKEKRLKLKDELFEDKYVKYVTQNIIRVLKDN